jgi:nitrate reductase molybdenum cofactor assembly chaperone NarJ/NarW
MRTLKVLSALLSYPTTDLVDAASELKGALKAERLLTASDLSRLFELVDSIANGDLFDVQERYVMLFDRTRSLSLHLFEHVHGESRDRGQAMVDLIGIYEAEGYLPSASELPDYLPMFLEFAATRPPEAALELVSQPGHVFSALKERLEKRGSPYAAAFSALASLASVKPDPAALAAIAAEPDDDPNDLEELDRQWEDEEVIFGPAAQDACGRDGLVAKLRAGNRPAPGMPAKQTASQRVVINTPGHAGS